MAGVKSRLLNTAVLGSQFLNVWIFNGFPDETISGRCYRQGELNGDKKWRRRQRKVDAVFRFLLGQENHCELSHQRDVHFARFINAHYRGPE